MPILDVSVKVSNARIVDGGDCGGAFLTWLGPISSFSMVGAWKDPTSA
jgi:hypothetical protein